MCNNAKVIEPHIACWEVELQSYPEPASETITICIDLGQAEIANTSNSCYAMYPGLW